MASLVGMTQDVRCEIVLRVAKLCCNLAEIFIDLNFCPPESYHRLGWGTPVSSTNYGRD